MLAEAKLVQLTARYNTLTRRYAAAAGSVVGQAWDRLDSWERADADRLVAMARPAVSTLSLRANAATSGYLSIVLDDRLPVSTVVVEPDWDSALIALRRSLAAGEAWEQALVSGRIRSEAVGANAVVRSGRLAAQVADDRVVGWTRTLSAKACEWCQLVSTQRYRTAESADFGHDHCSCGVAPIIGDADPGRVVNQQLLTQLTAER